MQKKIALLVLPAMLVLSGCGVKPTANNKIFLEDTLAHEELFNGGVSAIEFNLRKQAVNENNDEVSAQPVGSAAKSVSAPSIGYQIQYDEDNDKLAIRFVAAVKETNVKAYWRRGIAAPDGSIPQSKKFSDGTQEADKYYLALSDGQTPIEIGQGNYVDYAGFVVYTLRNIPYTANKGSYVAAYLNLVNQDDASIHNNSQGLAVKIEKETNYKSANAFAFDPTVTGHFLEGTINGTLFDGKSNGLYRESDPSRKNDSDFAWYENISLKTTDSFGSFYYEQDKSFEFFGASKYFKESAGFFEKSTGLSDYVKPILEGTYELHISSGNANHVYSEAKSYVGSLDSYTKLYLIPGEWNKDGAWFNAHFFGGADADLSMSDSDGDGVYEVAIPSGATKVVICRMGPNAGDSSLNWYINDRPVWNKTSDLILADRFNAAGPLGACTITAAGNYNQQWLGGASNIMR